MLHLLVRSPPGHREHKQTAAVEKQGLRGNDGLPGGHCSGGIGTAQNQFDQPDCRFDPKITSQKG